MSEILNKAAETAASAIMRFKAKTAGRYYPGYHEDMRDAVKKAILAERVSLSSELDHLREENDMLRYALAPFAAVAKHDIGADETSSDFFQPMEKNNHADRLRVGHFRKAFNTFSLGGDVDEL